MNDNDNSPIPFTQRHGRMLEKHASKLDDHTRKLDDHTRKLDDHTGKLDTHTRLLADHGHLLIRLVDTQNVHSKELHRLGLSMESIQQDTKIILDVVLSIQAKQQKYDAFDNKNHQPRTPYFRPRKSRP